ncbi:fibronectin type III domain-containing protein [Flavobacterium sp. 1355]|uniref:fibronectin type III domain-containing protein n=1 Tax=Flavobacterium sp. 1355 TaxID=2806571 RepID=UPI001AE9427F|nr:fibronectin type III domain-containing protein [Flavobacterium sp. 1355]MBP1222692.1 TANFOR domain-containing protein [Flavobacterium sp. 1355]
MKKNFTRFLFLLLFIWSFESHAQLFPVQLTPVFNSPYSLKLSDYATSMDTKMQLMINPTDIMISNRPVRLKLYIQGNGLNIQSSDYMQGQKPLFINGGELQTLTNTDIAALFRLENLQGITTAQYANGLPEGMYSFCFEMYDFVTNQKISQKSCASLYLILNDPPLLNTPQKNEQIAATDFPNIMFTWTPRQRNATNVSYKFELKQLLDPSLDPQFAFQMAPVLYEETLFGTALLYNLNMPILTPGMRYAWRVRAISTTGLSENAIFKNDGYSEIYSFKYTQKCDPPTFALSEIVSPSSVKISWQGLPDHTKYQVQYRKQAVVEANKRGKEKQKNFEWFSTYTNNNQALLTNLEQETTYEFKVGSTCTLEGDGVQSFNYSNTNTFKIPKKENGIASYNCGIVPKINIQNQKPLTNLIQSETFTAGDFPVTVLELQEKHSPYSGKGYIIVPYLADTKIAVEFNNILINTDYQLISGVVETSYNADWKNVTDIEDFTGEGQGGQIEETVKFEIKNIVINANGDIVVNGKNGEQVTIPGGKDTVITDSTGKVYGVDSKGNGSSQGTEPAPGGKPTPENTDGVDKSGQATAFTAQGVTIAFSGNGSKYAFDVMPNNATATIQKLYKKVDDAVLPYKAVLNGDTDTVVATVTITDTIVKPDKIVFKTQNGANVSFTRNGKTFILTVKGNQTYAEEQILAVIQQGERWKVIGAFMLVHISAKEVNLVLVPLNKETQIPSNAENEISAVYKKAGIKMNITRSEKVNYTDADGKIQVGDSDFFETYTNEEQTINNLIKKSGSYKSDSYYLIYSDLPASNPAIKGFMALKGQFGYVFANGDNRIASHELGHGIFGLEHPFKNKTEEGKTDFLMDYGNGLNLWHNDWKQINDPKFRLYLFQGDAEGEYETDGHYSTVYLVSLMLGMDPVKALELAKATEAPDTTIHSPMNFELNDTWGHPGGAQQEIHSLNGGFHGIEEFFTAIKFLYSAIGDIKTQGELLHRFGDTYAHTRIGNLKPQDIKENLNLKEADDATIKKYIDSWKKIKSETTLGSQVQPWIKFFNYYLQKDGLEFLNSETKQKEIFKGRTLKEALKDLYLTNNSSGFIMYGEEGYTGDHFQSDGGYPDQIFLRPDWYHIYVQNLSWLIASKYKLNNLLLNLSVFDKMINFIVRNKCSMKGIIDYEIAKLRNEKVVYVPIYYANGKILAAVDEALSDYEKRAVNVVEYTVKYLGEQGIPPSRIKVTRTDRVVVKQFSSASGAVSLPSSSTTIEAFVITIN